MKKMRSWGDSLVALQTLADISDELALVFVSGPGELAEKGLTQIESLLSEKRKIVRHRLTPESADLVEPLSQIDTPRSALLVHGLEDLEDSGQFERVAKALNLGRDALGKFESLVVLWVPEDDLEKFRLFCPDLFHWRSMVMTATDGELRQDFIARWRYLDSAIAHRESSRLAIDLPHRQVRFERFHSLEKAHLFTWADIVTRGLLRSSRPDAELKDLLDHYALLRLRRARNEATELIPVQISWDVVPANAESNVLSPITQSVKTRCSSVSRETVEYWAQKGDFLWLMVSGKISLQDERDRVSIWLSRLLVSYPGNFVIAASAPSEMNFERWQIADLEDQDTRIDEQRPLYSEPFTGVEGAPIRASQNAVSAFIRSLDPNLEPSVDVRRTSAKALANSHDPRAVDALIRSLSPGFEDDLGIWETAARALPPGDARALAVLLRHLDPEVSKLSRKWISLAIAAICQKNPAHTQQLSRLLDQEVEPDSEIRSSIVKCLELALGPEVALEVPPVLVD